MNLDLTVRACPICGSTSESTVFAEARLDAAALDDFAFASRKMPEYMHARLISCPVCDLVYANPAPSPDMIAAAYRTAAFDSGEEAGFAAGTYAKLLANIEAGLPDRHGALDIGTGEGAFLGHLLDRGWTGVRGVEPSEAPIAAASDTVRPLIRHGLFRAGDFEPRQFSLITCFQTLEHVPDPLELCRGALRLLKPGGALLIVVHNRRAMSAKLLGRRSPIFDIEHLQLFSPESARQLMARAGYARTRRGIVFNRYPLHYLLKLFPIPRKPKRVLIAASKRLLVGYLPLVLPLGNLAVVGYRDKLDAARQ